MVNCRWMAAAIIAAVGLVWASVAGVAGATPVGGAAGGTVGGPANDDCAAAFAIGEVTAEPFDMTGSTFDQPVFSCDTIFDMITGNTWYDYTASATGMAVMSAVVDTTIGAEIFESDDCTIGIAIACNEDIGRFPVSFPVTAGQRYRISLNRHEKSGPSPSGTFALVIEGRCCVDAVCMNTDTMECAAMGGVFTGDVTCAEAGCPPANDDCADATAVAEGFYPFDTTNATGDGPDHPQPLIGENLCIPIAEQDVWFCYTATVTDTVTIDTCTDTMFDTVLFIYDGCGEATVGNLIACNDNGGCGLGRSRLDLAATAGETYKIRIDGFNADDSGAGQLSIVPMQGVISACCLDTGVCLENVFTSECDAAGGMYMAGAECAVCPQPGACCFDDGSCTMNEVLERVSGECAAAGGMYAGDGSACDPNPCPQPGACCFTDGSCAIVLPGDCAGVFEGPGTMCAPNPCPQPGACCFDDGSCLMNTILESAGDDCTIAGGTYQGDDTSCDPNPCPQPGACCFEDGTCLRVQPGDCAGVFDGAGSMCDPNPCPQPGACCFPDGSCEINNELEGVSSECANLNGVYQGDGTGCTPNPCTQPGACCVPDGTCFQNQFLESFIDDCADVGGVYQGDDTQCGSADCPQPGACCVSDGTCVVNTELDSVSGECAGAGGVYQGDGSTCDPNPCPQPGACCFPDGACEINDALESVSGECAGLNGVYQGDGTGCAPNPCTQPGACCVPDGTCFQNPFLESFIDDCADVGGVYQGDDTLCATANCPQPGACCMTDGTCTMNGDLESISGECAAAGGVYQGDGSMCDPTPCPQPGVCCAPNGVCRQLLDLADVGECGDSYLGDDTFCGFDNSICPQPGACCFVDGTCDLNVEVETFSGECEAAGGVYQGDDVACTPDLCPVLIGACCLCDNTCDDQLTGDACASMGGMYFGNESLCTDQDVDCGLAACCFSDLSCMMIETKDACENEGGVWQGRDTTCMTIECPINCAVNESFETGDFTGWTFDDPPNPDFPLQVVGPGVQHPNFDSFESDPTHGCFAAVHGWDGDGPNQMREVIRQVLTIPETADELCFDWRAEWDNISDDDRRRFRVILEDPDTGDNIIGQTIFDLDFDDDDSNDGEMSGTPTCIDVSSIRGQEVRLKFRWIFGDTVDGDVFFQLDNIRWTCTDCDNDSVPDCVQVVPEVDPDPAAVGTGADDCDDAMDVTSGVWYPVDTTGATGGPTLDESIVCGPQFGQKSVFFHYTPKFSGDHVSIQRQNLMPLGQNFVIAVYDTDGGCPGNLIDCQIGNQPAPLFSVEAGETYIIAIAAQNFAEGQLEFMIVGPGAILNEDDINENGVPDECECQGDVNNDGNIDGMDFVQVLQNLGDCDGCPEDANMDGSVDMDDLQLIQDSMGPCMAFEVPNGMNPLNAPKVNPPDSRRDTIVDQHQQVETIRD